MQKINPCILEVKLMIKGLMIKGKFIFLIYSLLIIANAVTSGYCESLQVVPIYDDSPVKSKVALIHFNPALNDLSGNVKELTNLIEEALVNGANFVLTPELSTTGYSITEQDVRSKLGIQAPFAELEDIKKLAQKYSAYVVIGIAEKTNNDQLFNSAVVLLPDKSFKIVRKRGVAGFNKRGNLPFIVLNTKYGDIGVVICSDAYLPEITRIISLKGADIILSPANWWGEMNQLEIWSTRAHKNSFYFLIANRWGKETDERYPPNKYEYDMNDAPTAAIAPDGERIGLYRAKDTINPKNRIVYQDIVVPKSRIGTKINPSWSASYRRPSVYIEMANGFYRSDLSQF